jgi:hypothetical protein
MLLCVIYAIPPSLLRPPSFFFFLVSIFFLFLLCSLIYSITECFSFDPSIHLSLTTYTIHVFSGCGPIPSHEFIDRSARRTLDSDVERIHRDGDQRLQLNAEPAVEHIRTGQVDDDDGLSHLGERGLCDACGKRAAECVKQRDGGVDTARTEFGQLGVYINVNVLLALS